jgi:hypothetical protein
VAYPAKGYDKYEINRLRAIRTEVTGDWYLPSFNQLKDDDNRVIGRVKSRGEFIQDDEGNWYRPVVNVYNPMTPEDYKDDSIREAIGAAPNQNPVPLTNIPTSTTNYRRPRTVAAGYQRYMDNPQEGKLTVMFRDGTLYNYYNVTSGDWIIFRNSISKGPLLNRGTKGNPDGMLLKYPHGPAAITDVPEAVQSQLYRIAREAQIRYRYRKGTPKAAARKAQFAPRSATSRRLGQNPSQGGRNPYQR